MDRISYYFLGLLTGIPLSLLIIYWAFRRFNKKFKLNLYKGLKNLKRGNEYYEIIG